MLERNHILATWAMVSLVAYDKISGGGLKWKGLFPMLLASMMHLCDRENWQFDELLAEARKTYEAEKSD